MYQTETQRRDTDLFGGSDAVLLRQIHEKTAEEHFLEEAGHQRHRHGKKFQTGRLAPSPRNKGVSAHEGKRAHGVADVEDRDDRRGDPGDGGSRRNKNVTRDLFRARSVKRPDKRRPLDGRDAQKRAPGASSCGGFEHGPLGWQFWFWPRLR